MKIAIKRYVGIGKETGGYGVAAAASRYVEAVDTFQPDPGVKILDPVAQRVKRDKVLTKFRARGNIGSWEVKPEDIIGEALLGVLGSVSSAQQGGTSAYKHTFTRADTFPSWTLRKGVELNELVYPGCLFNQLTIQSRHAEILKAILEVFGVGAAPTKTTLATLSDSDFCSLQPWVYHQGTITLYGSDESSRIYDSSIMMNNNIPIDRGGHGSQYIPKIRSGDFALTGKVSTYFDKTDDYDKFIAGTEFALNEKWIGALIADTYYYTLELDLPRCVFTGRVAPENKPIHEPLIIPDAAFEALKGDTPSDWVVKAYLTNTITAY